MRIVKTGDSGAPVTDVQMRLLSLGYELNVDGNFAENTEAAVRAFRESCGLSPDAIVDQETWTALVDASFGLGDRTLYLRMPHFHGQDVRQLQKILNVLGFVCGETDGIYGVHTEHALCQFQSSAGLADDGIAGNATYEAIERLRHTWEGKSMPTADDAGEHRGFARAVTALETMDLCFFGLDEVGRHIARRIANLASATTEDTHITNAAALKAPPLPGTTRVGIVCDGEVDCPEGIPVVSCAEDYTLAQRLRTALQSVPEDDRRLYVEVSVQDVAEAGTLAVQRREQHLAVTLLDAFCEAYE
ncbi:MAG: peptidoglycan-binding protein [Coriobacteriaceae bacterium]|nr:peptidoglycan-binding protein [Coriobacteriaceae bacterium]